MASSEEPSIRESETPEQEPASSREEQTKEEIEESSQEPERPEDFHDESILNPYEIANRDLIVQYEKDMGYQ